MNMATEKNNDTNSQDDIKPNTPNPNAGDDHAPQDSWQDAIKGGEDGSRDAGDIDLDAAIAADNMDAASDAAGDSGNDQGAEAAPLDPLEAMTAERDQLKDQLLRSLADMENMRRRTERETASARKYGHTNFSRDLVGAIDNLARAMQATTEAKADTSKGPMDEAMVALLTGIELSWTEILSVIEKHGIKQVSPKDEKFDYNLHQAMFEVPTDEVAPGTVVEVVQHGYVLHDRLLRPAMVGVSKAVQSEKS
ncbi:nucleotide exchange factor GrpE [Alphaproteobacteria bacterium]|jgi:molecular chaperone GrpE|nr:nucleotide exchange factor GrpE [Alphaproteobacteria bacterium]